MDVGKSKSRMWVERGVLAAIALLALGIRLYYVRTAVVDHPLRGDAVQYFSYALNLLNHHTFSMALPGAESFAPDSFRDPGYPTFLAILAFFKGSGAAFYITVLEVQCCLSAITVWTFAILARRWMGFGAAVALGCLMALWPHGITLGGYVLSETLMGCLVALALLASDNAMRTTTLARAAVAGFAFGLAALTNAVVLPFAPLAAAWMLWRDGPRRRFWATLLICALLPSFGWGIRAMSLPAGQSSGDRAAINFVQGSWPEYHPEYMKSVEGEPIAVMHMKAMDAEFQALRTNRSAGLRLIGARFRSDPMRYLDWYLSKPIELWGWNIGIGQGDIYVFPTENSPLTSQGLLGVTTGICFFLNPFVMLLALVGAVLALILRMPPAPGLRLAAALGFFVTGVFGILQSDARYATPFRGIELALAVLAVTVAAKRLRAIKERNLTQPT